jgi:homoserine O-acetyltransferase
MFDANKIISKGASSLTKQVALFDNRSPLTLDNGRTLSDVIVSYETYGRLNGQKNNAIVLCHALTGSAHAAGAADEPGWWQGCIGSGKAFDPDKHFIVCSNFLGGCYGTTGPLSLNPTTGKPYLGTFPEVTVRDMVRVQKRLLDSLGVKEALCVAGGSLGGMQVLEWALLYPEIVKSIVPIATAAAHSGWAIGFNEAARRAIQNDPKWNDGDYTEQPALGLKLAREIAMISYRSPESFHQRFGRKTRAYNGTEMYEAESYLLHQGERLLERFDAATYILITRAMDSHDVGKERGSVKEVLGRIRAKTLCLGIDTDILYPVWEQQEIAASIPGASYREITSLHGHDAFLIEYEQLNKIVSEFLVETSEKSLSPSW